MGNVCSSKAKNGGPRKLTLAILGLDNAGKTVTTKGLQGETLDTVAPTVGFSDAEFVFNGYHITLFDLGGGKRIRDIWKNYFAEIYGVIYVLDSSEPERLEESQKCLSDLLRHEKISGKPILVLANKQDKAGALDEIDICEQLNLERMVNKNKCPCRVETCAAILGQGKKLDKSIKAGMTWLLQTIGNMGEKLRVRVEQDVTDLREKEAKERQERRELVRKAREERERQEALKNGGKPVHDSDDEIEGDPFKRVDAKALAKKEAKMREEKKRRKELEQQNRFRGPSYGGGSDPEDHTGTRPRVSPLLSRRHRGAGSDPEDNDRPRPSSPKPYREDSDSGEDVPPQRIQRSRGHGETFSKPTSNGLHNGYGRTPLGPSPRPSLRRDVHSRHRTDSNSDDDDNELDYNQRKSQLNGNRSLRPYDLKPAPSLTPRLSPRGLGAGEEEAENRTLYGRRPLMPLAPLQPLDGGDAGRKKKKKKAKKNQTSPLVSEGDDVGGEYQPKLNPFAPRGWNTPPGQRSMLKASQTPRLETLKEPDNERSDTENMNSFSSKWGLVDDLPELPTSTMSRRPNSEYDYDIVT